jgi:hypothetical protein
VDGSDCSIDATLTGLPAQTRSWWYVEAMYARPVRPCGAFVFVSGDQPGLEVEDPGRRLHFALCGRVTNRSKFESPAFAACECGVATFIRSSGAFIGQISYQA